MTEAEAKALLSKASCTVPDFARAFGLSRNAAYVAVKRGEVKSARVGKRIIIPTAQLRRMLSLEDVGARGRST